MAERQQRGRWTQRVVVMVREPVAGAVKTRLARGLGVGRTTNVYRHTSRHVVARLQADPRWETWLAVTPRSGLTARAWAGHLPRRAQGNGDLGQRMQRVFDHMPPGPLVIVGTDIPEINAPRIAAAFATLGSHDAVIGPATDGGYWLIGLARRRPPPCIFANVRWSTSETRADTEANLEGLSVAHVDTLDDVDDVRSFAQIGHLGGRRILPVRQR